MIPALLTILLLNPLAEQIDAALLGIQGGDRPTKVAVVKALLVRNKVAHDKDAPEAIVDHLEGIEDQEERMEILVDVLKRKTKPKGPEA